MMSTIFYCIVSIVCVQFMMISLLFFCTNTQVLNQATVRHHIILTYNTEKYTSFYQHGFIKIIQLKITTNQPKLRDHECNHMYNEASVRTVNRRSQYIRTYTLR